MYALVFLIWTALSICVHCFPFE